MPERKGINNDYRYGALCCDPLLWKVSRGILANHALVQQRFAVSPTFTALVGYIKGSAQVAHAASTISDGLSDLPVGHAFAKTNVHAASR